MSKTQAGWDAEERNSAVAGPRLLSADWRAIKHHNFKPLYAALEA